MLQLRKDCKYSLIVASSMGVRITPVNSQPVHSSKLFEMHATSAETNVATISSSLGLPVKVLTTFVKDSPIAAFIKSDLRARNIDYEGVEVPQGDPWGYRHQFNIADSGFGLRGPRVQNDRAGEVGKTLNVKDFDLERIFVKEGVQILHLSGLIAALSPETSNFCLELARYAKKQGTLISFDLNYRATFWKGREKELREAFAEIASLSDILIGNEEDFQLCLDVQGPKAGGENIEDAIDAFKGMILNARKAFPQVSVFANTLREVVSANEHLWGAIVYENENWHVAPLRKINVIDRIGGGDGFVGGLLYSILKGMPSEKWIQFAWASGALATTFLTDYAQPADEEMIWSIWKGNARVKR
ncbi:MULTISPECIES: sugar kinase [Petrimonas]|jgi:2-dehydro-3-deoxygluconokinase|uniref:2-dehydro-3-deoxygluconokinase n=1 Tax=Petrimonas mucosa TaxID=1642646 RepID=A0A1G4G3Z9_9BACT|nr:MULTISPECIES: sugar kinase [Petrimonas]MDD3561143.1 sugar kinase [Petrimonas mucosa]SCM55476.1 2-dehydro-3-deoxygluconokinase [Petrimonas mucosa]SFU41487.1 2-dehydro-3-deoxygluconokinase [Porphyromonadaceae bacterium KHP3R9]HHT29883.1 sugar kinase [Petrimonas mucosa]